MAGSRGCGLRTLLVLFGDMGHRFMVLQTTEGDKSNHGDYRPAGGLEGTGQSQNNVF